MSEPAVHGSTNFAGEQYTAASGQASTITRSLGLSAIAVIWLFGGGLTPKDSTPQELLNQIQDAGWLMTGLVAALAALFLDLAHYVWASACWGGFHRALDGVLERDDGSQPMSTGYVTKVWERASRWKIVDQIEARAQRAGAAPSSEQQRRIEARDALQAAIAETGPAFSPLRRWVESPVSPPFIRRGILTLFAAKIAAVVVSFVCIGDFLIRS